jgi:transposase
MMETTETRYAGIDVSKGWCDVALEAGRTATRFDQTPDGRKAMVDWLKAHGVSHAVLEASGGYERPVLRALDNVGLQACLVPPHRVRALARAAGRLAKTDALDAATLAAFGRLLGPRERLSQDEQSQALAALVRRRRQIVDMMTLEDNRRQQEDEPDILADIQALLDLLRGQLEAIDRRIASQIRTSERLRGKHDVLTDFVGVGPVVSAVLLAEMPELGSLDAKQAASLAGLAPFNNDSGTSHKPRSIHGGRVGVRCALFMAALSAIRHNPEIRAFYKRLRDNGKPQKVAHIAAARKIIVILNAMLRDATSPRRA